MSLREVCSINSVVWTTTKTSSPRSIACRIISTAMTVFPPAVLTTTSGRR